MSDPNSVVINYGAIAGMLKQLAKISVSENDRGVSFRASHIGAQAAACEAMIETQSTSAIGPVVDDDAVWRALKAYQPTRDWRASPMLGYDKANMRAALLAALGDGT